MKVVILVQKKAHKIFHEPIPPPCSTMSFFSSFSTFLLRRLRSSGLITRFFASLPEAAASCFALPAARGRRESEPDVDAAAVASSDLCGLDAGFLCRVEGSGKLSFLSIASTVR